MKVKSYFAALVKCAVIALFFTSASQAMANAAPLELELGKATILDLEEKFPTAKRLSDTDRMGGPFYTYNSDYKNPMIREAQFGFDEKGILARVNVFIARDRWDNVLLGLNEKYKRSEYVFHKELARDGRKYLAPHDPTGSNSPVGQFVFQDGETIIHADSRASIITYFNIADHPKMAAHVEKLRSDRLKAIVNKL